MKIHVPINRTMKLILKSKFACSSLKDLLFVSLVVLSLTLKAPLHAQAASAYRFQNFTNFYSYGAGISNSQVVVGTIYDAPEFSGSAGAVGSLITRSSSKVRNTYTSYDSFNAVNSSNVIVGAGGGNDNPEDLQAFTLRDGVYTLLRPMGSGGPASSSIALGINDLGVIVGGFSDRLGQHGFVLQSGIYKVLDVPGMITTSANGINNLGVVTVQATASDGHVNSYLYQNGTYTLLNVPGAQSSFIRGINDLGMIVFGYRSSVGALPQSKVYYRGKFTDLVYPGSRTTSAIGINNAGVISGNAEDPFVATPIR